MRKIALFFLLLAGWSSAHAQGYYFCHANALNEDKTHLVTSVFFSNENNLMNIQAPWRARVEQNLGIPIGAADCRGDHNQQSAAFAREQHIFAFENSGWRIVNVPP
ncbi:hypothetical protein [Ensifer aridi]|uniref:hypothetical protein n=1 Tax=Ensifer aridi TaxID=1708715 RepID=UPI00111BFBE5|nr:hypothetical protein [Ensifer aridi]